MQSVQTVATPVEAAEVALRVNCDAILMQVELRLIWRAGYTHTYTHTRSTLPHNSWTSSQNTHRAWIELVSSQSGAWVILVFSRWLLLFARSDWYASTFSVCDRSKSASQKNQAPHFLPQSVPGWAHSHLLIMRLYDSCARAAGLSRVRLGKLSFDLGHSQDLQSEDKIQLGSPAAIFTHSRWLNTLGSCLGVPYLL